MVSSILMAQSWLVSSHVNWEFRIATVFTAFESSDLKSEVCLLMERCSVRDLVIRSYLYHV